MALARSVCLAVLLVFSAGSASAYVGSPTMRRLLIENGSPVPFRRLAEVDDNGAFRRLLDENSGSPVPMRRLIEAVEEEFHYCMSPHEVLSQRDEYSTFMSAVEVADLQDILSDSSNDLMVFAPNNAAFDAFLEVQGMAADDFLSDAELVSSFFRAHLTTDTAALDGFQLTASEEQPLVKCSTVLYAVDNVVVLPLEAEQDLEDGLFLGEREGDAAQADDA